MSQASTQGFLAAYDAAIARGDIRADAAQRKAAEAFETLYQQLSQPQTPLKRRWLKLKSDEKPTTGLYVWGDVGRGKSMLMDVCVSVVEKTTKTRRVHFHAFMRDVHKRLFAYRQTQSSRVMEEVIAELAAEQRLLCLDELQVTDVTDAMILARLFAGLMDAGVAIVFTSNRHPRDLYQGGLQREQFLKFVDLLEARLPIIKIDGPEDYRLAQLKAMQHTYMYPRDEIADEYLLETWEKLTHGAPSERLVIEVDGRSVRVEKYAHGVAWLTFGELCMRPLGASDYLELCRYCHTVILQGIPRLSREDRNEARRFVTLIDALYDHRIKLIATAETPPEGIYAHGDGTFEFARTVSRLIEMQGEKYLAAGKV